MASALRPAADRVTYTPPGTAAMSHEPNPTLQRQVDAEALRTVLSSSAVTTLPGVALALIAAVMLWPHAVPHFLIPWVIAVAATYAARAWFITSYQRRAQSSHEDVSSWRTGMIIHAGLGGAAWGTLGLMPLTHAGLTQSMFVGFVLTGVTTTAIGSLGSYRPAVYAFIGLAIAPFGVSMLLNGSSFGLGIGVMSLLYLAAMVSAVRRIGERIAEGVRQRIEREAQGIVLRRTSREVAAHQGLTAAIARAQAHFIRDAGGLQMCLAVAKDVLELTASRNAFLGEVLRGEDGSPRLRSHGVANAVDFIDEVWLIDGTCMSAVVAQGEAFVANDLTEPEAQRHGLPAPCLQAASCACVPLKAGGEVVAVLGMTDRDGGYDAALLTYLEPLLITVAQLIVAVRSETQRREAERNLDLTRAQLETCVSDTPAAVAMLDNSLRFIACSRRWLSDFGAAANTRNGTPLYDAVPEIPARWREAFERALNGEIESTDEDPFIRADGSVRWLRWEARPWSQGGRVGGLVLFSTDVTDEKKMTDMLYARERLLQELTSCVPGVLYQARVRANGEMTVLFASSQSERLFGVPSQALMESARQLHNLIHPEDRPAVLAALRRTDTDHVSVQARMQTPNGWRCFQFEAEATRLADASTVWHGYLEPLGEATAATALSDAEVLETPVAAVPRAR